jgi:S1-C subfamily serine protease
VKRTPRYQSRILIAILMAGSTTNLGVVIVKVQPESITADARIRQGDAIQVVHRRPVTTLLEFKDAINHSANSILLLVNRDGRTLFTVVKHSA